MWLKFIIIWCLKLEYGMMLINRHVEFFDLQSNMRRVAASGHSASQSSWLFVSEKPNDYYKTRTSSPPPVYTTV